MFVFHMVLQVFDILQDWDQIINLSKYLILTLKLKHLATFSPEQTTTAQNFMHLGRKHSRLYRRRHLQVKLFISNVAATRRLDGT